MRARSSTLQILLPVAFALGFAQSAAADLITDWNEKSGDIVSKAAPGAEQPRMLAIVQVAVFEAVNSIDTRYKPYLQGIPAAKGASVEAAVAAANRATLSALVPSEKAAIEAAYQSALAGVPDGAGKRDGIAVGEKAAAQTLAHAAKDGFDATHGYQPHTTPGRYVPTAIPVFISTSRRTPWILAKPDQFRPGPPPELGSETWEKDLDEVKRLGGKTGSSRTAEHTDIATFWEETRPVIYQGVLRSVANMPGRTVAQNARFMAAASVAQDDARIACFDAKYAYNFWRPVTAIRNDHTAGKTPYKADIQWSPFINTPMHPEYPCAHCVASGAIGAAIKAELAGTPAPKLITRSPLARNAERSWTSVEDFMQEVQMARIYDGVHFRNSTVVGNDLGMKVGAYVMERFATRP